MDVTTLDRMSLRELVEYADTHDIQLYSRICMATTYYDIARASGLPGEYWWPRRYGYELSLNTEQLIVEAGFNYDLIEDIPENDYEYEREYIDNITEPVYTKLREVGFSNLDDLYSKVAVGVYSAVHIKNNTPLRDYQYDTLSLETIFKMNLSNLRALTGIDNDTYDECLKFLNVEKIWPEDIFYYQNASDLYEYADQFGKEPYFRTKNGVISYLLNIKLHDLISYDPEIFGRRIKYPGISEHNISIIEYFKNINNKYSRRQELVTKATKVNKKLILNLFSAYGDILLALPPHPFEERILTAIVDGENLIDIYPQLKNLTPLDINNIKYFILASDGIQIQSRQQLFDLRHDKQIRYVSPGEMYRITGWKYVIPYIECRRYLIKDSSFTVITNTDLCPNTQDVFLQPFVNYAITYGTFTDFHCYNVDELMDAIQINPDYVQFLIPNTPTETFTVTEINELIESLVIAINSCTSQVWVDKFNQLLQQVKNVLLRLSKNPSAHAKRAILSLSEDDKYHLVQIFRSLFATGMYQRTWRGEGYPYPMTYESTKGSCLNEIEVKMTEPLNKIQDEIMLLSPRGSQVFKSLFMVNRIQDEFITTNNNINEFIGNIRRAKFCIAVGNSLMIYTSYYYLSILGYKIDNFDVDAFDPRSTNR